MKTLMIKRLESSFLAFKISLGNLTHATARMIEMFENGKVLIAPDLNVNNLMDKGYSIEAIEEFILERSFENPQNRVFASEDFEEGFLEGLKKDHSLLQELVEAWEKVEEDPKLDAFLKALESEFLSSQINPTGKLVIFTESKDTADYLQREIEAHLGTEILNISAANRRKVFETIQENFDANYDGKQKNDYKILVTTDVLAEGVNLHRANVIVNYDTPWNATRLMQRIGRINRIGSVAGVIHNYNFYPSPQGDYEIRLYNNALVKLQGFHTAFGEDAQIFTHEELVEQFELFKEGMTDEEDNRLYYLRLVREFKDLHPREYKRIKQFPAKARTSRSLTNIGKEGVIESTVVFLKSPYKTEFYLVDKEMKATTMTFLEAAQLFEARSDETAFDIPERHYDEVQAALDSFERDFFGSVTEPVASGDKADAVTNQARKFLRDIKSLTKLDEVKSICDALYDLVSRGTYAQLPNEIKKVKQKLDKKQLTYGQVDNFLTMLARKFDAKGPDNNEASVSASEMNTNIEPEVVLSETFIN
jgi:superfamily II DNA/RNA helicase